MIKVMITVRKVVIMMSVMLLTILLITIMAISYQLTWIIVIIINSNMGILMMVTILFSKL